MKNKILVTGGCGFIGSNFIKYILETTDYSVVNLDKQTYAGQGENIEHMGLSENDRYTLVIGDIVDEEFIEKLFEENNFEYVFNFAAESHVDRSWENIEQFEKSNVLGTGILLATSWLYEIKRFIHISTDEVYGSIKEGSFTEKDELNPTNPYSKSKADAEVLVRHYNNLGLDTIITRSANNYGEYQFPEKLLSLFITNLIEGKKVPLMWTDGNKGLNVRDWLNVKDNVRAIWFASQNGKNGERRNNILILKPLSGIRLYGLCQK